jgi:uncharacterized FlgJ-related protein
MSAVYDQTIYDVAIRNGFSLAAAKLVVAQARFESADYTSNVFQKNLNTSGMKYIGQPLASRGTLAPMSERSASCRRGESCVNSDYYAKFSSIADSVKDKIERNYSLTIRGVTPDQLKKASSPEEFAQLLKQRGYYGDTVQNYSRGLKSKLLRIQVVDFVSKNRNYLLIGSGLVLLAVSYYLYTKK